jgi:hypothetical protein
MTEKKYEEEWGKLNKDNKIMFFLNKIHIHNEVLYGLALLNITISFGILFYLARDTKGLFFNTFFHFIINFAAIFAVCVIIYHTFLSIRLNYLLKKGEFFKND